MKAVLLAVSFALFSGLALAAESPEVYSLNSAEKLFSASDESCSPQYTCSSDASCPVINNPFWGPERGSCMQGCCVYGG
jgi:hypothetical protein